MVKPRAELSTLKVCEHGGKREQTVVSKLLDFSTNLNPYGPPEFVFDAITDALAELSRYPDSENRELSAKLARKYGCLGEEVLVGAGVSELIQLVAHSFAADRVLMLKHTYGEYEIASRVIGASVKRIEMPELQIKPELIVEAMQPGDVVFLCNPNNPTGQYLAKSDLKHLIEESERIDALLVIDEAYVDFVDAAYPSHSAISTSRNLLILRSLTKSFAIPGVRIGYAIGTAGLIKTMRKIKVPWSVSVFADKIGMAVTGEAGDVFLKDTRAQIERSKTIIEQALAVHSDTNFFILDVGDASKQKKALLKQGLVVRDCTSFGLPAHIRFSVRLDADNDLLIQSLLKAWI
ncbi:MAG: histidinol-phosphate transaminase [Halobacteriota archaeon]